MNIYVLVLPFHAFNYFRFAFFYFSLPLSSLLFFFVVAASDWTDSFFFFLRWWPQTESDCIKWNCLLCFRMMEQTFKTAKIFFGNRHIDNLDSKMALYFFLLRARGEASNCVCVYVKGSCFWPLSTRADKCSIRYTSILSQTIIDIWAKF